MRRLAWPPSSPSASRPSWSRSKTTPRASRSRTALGASSTSTFTADGRQRPRPAAIVSAAWRSGESSGSSAAASPPWAQKLALWESGVRETRQTLPPRSAARNAVQRPAAPPPTTTTSNSATAAIAAQPLGGSSPAAPAARRRRFPGPAPSRRRPRARPARPAARPPRPASPPPRPAPRSRRGGLGRRDRLAPSACALALQVGLQRLDLGAARRSAALATSAAALQPAFGLFDLCAEASRLGSRFAHRAQSITGCRRRRGRPRSHARPSAPLRARRPLPRPPRAGRGSRGGGRAAALHALASNSAQRQPPMPASA